MLTPADVHTTGVNWTSVGTIVGSVLTGAGAILTTLARWINNRITEHREATSGQIAEIAKALTGRLDAVDRTVGDVNLRVARLEGPVRRINNAVNGGDTSIRENVQTLTDRSDVQAGAA